MAVITEPIMEKKVERGMWYENTNEVQYTVLVMKTADYQQNKEVFNGRMR